MSKERATGMQSIDFLTHGCKRIGRAVGDTLMESCRPEDRRDTQIGIRRYILEHAGASLCDEADDVDYAQRVYDALDFVAGEDVISQSRPESRNVCLMAYREGLEESIDTRGD